MSLLICPTQALGDWPDDPVEGLVSDSGDESVNSAVGVDESGRFLVAYEREVTEPCTGTTDRAARTNDLTGLDNK